MPCVLPMGGMPTLEASIYLCGSHGLELPSQATWRIVVGPLSLHERADNMTRRKFKLSHSISGLLALLAVQGALVYLAPVGVVAWLTLCFGIAGAAVTLYVATEIVEEVRGTPRMLTLLSAVVVEFVVFFAVEYWFLLIVSPGSFPTLAPDAASLALHSTMVFVFNPLYLPANFIGRAFLLINTASALGLVLFILQNIWHFRKQP